MGHHNHNLPHKTISFFPDSDYSDHSYNPLAPLASHTNLPAASISGPSPSNMSGINTIHHICSTIEKWTSSLGPVENWPRVFHELYNEACLNTNAPTTQSAINNFLGQVEEHVRIRKDILGGLEKCAVVKLLQSQCDEGDRLLAGDLMRTLHCSVTLLEARLELHMPLGPQESVLQSNIHWHEEFTP